MFVNELRLHRGVLISSYICIFIDISSTNVPNVCQISTVPKDLFFTASSVEVHALKYNSAVMSGEFSTIHFNILQTICLVLGRATAWQPNICKISNLLYTAEHVHK